MSGAFSMSTSLVCYLKPGNRGNLLRHKNTRYYLPGTYQHEMHTPSPPLSKEIGTKKHNTTRHHAKTHDHLGKSCKLYHTMIMSTVAAVHIVVSATSSSPRSTNQPYPLFTPTILVVLSSLTSRPHSSSPHCIPLSMRVRVL